MLAQNFKTPADLGISDKEFDALVKVLGMLERDELPFMPADVGDHRINYFDDFAPTFFNMSLIQSKNGCGSACCILGWARVVSQDDFLFNKRTFEASNLFMMPGPNGELHGFRGKFSNEIQPAEAAIALRNYLTHGEPCWAEALRMEG